jgi:hypothetical protein
MNIWGQVFDFEGSIGAAPDPVFPTPLCDSKTCGSVAFDDNVASFERMAQGGEPLHGFFV